MKITVSRADRRVARVGRARVDRSWGGRFKNAQHILTDLTNLILEEANPHLDTVDVDTLQIDTVEVDI